jgi:hypothetical protein
MKMLIMKTPNHTTTLFKTLALTGMLLFISYYGYGQQSLTTSFEPDKIHEIVIERMPSLSAELFGKDFVVNIEREVGFEKWMTDGSSWTKKRNNSIMDFEFVHAEKELALEAWMTQTFKLEDRMPEEDISVEEWMLADTEWFEMN